MNITSQMVKTLRDKTNAGMMDCKKALTECGGDIDKSVDWLRQKGLMTARKRAGRATREGLVLTKITGDGKVGAVVELNSETDFVSKMDSFREITESLVDYLATAPQAPENVEALLKAKCPKCGEEFGEVINRAVGTTGEVIRLRRFKVIKAGPNGLVHGYVHAGGRLGVLVELEVEKPGPAADDLAHNLAMHVAAINPMAIKIEHLPEDFVAKERAVHEAKSKEELEAKAQKSPGKAPKNIEGLLANMVNGKMKKSFTELVLLEQAYVKDPAKTVAALISEAGKELGKIEVLSFARFQLGEEIEGENASEE
ncbi:MAG: translation elongation factor Ts [Deltaproteobacteria bacterium]|jgi:elongation factor Ts|nr:translation elongation factor Ts [Deltaproteobacteria bacterium]